MTAPLPSPAEQAEIDRFGIFEPEIRVRLDIGAALAAFCDMDRDEADEYAEILLPTVQRIATELAAEAEAKVQRVEALVKAWEDDTRHWYYENRHAHENGINYVAGYEDGWNHADELLHAALDGKP